MTNEEITSFSENTVLNLSQRDLRRRFRGNFSVIAWLLNHHARPNETPLYDALKSFVASPVSKTTHDWDRLLSVAFLPPDKSLVDYLNEEGCWKTPEEYSPLLDSIASFLNLNPQQQGALSLKRAYLAVKTHPVPLIHSDNTSAFYLEMSGKVTTRQPLDKNPLQLYGINEHLSQMNPQNTQDMRFLKVLMGPCLHEAFAKAHQFFYDPVNLFLRQCFWLVFHAAQYEEQRPINDLRLSHALHHLLAVYTQTYPELSHRLTEKSEELFAENALNSPLFDTLTKFKALLDKDNPLLVDLLFMPTGFHQPQEYCLKNIEQAYLEVEKKRFQAETLDFLKTATHAQKEKLRHIFAVNNPSITDLAERITEIPVDFLDEKNQWLFNNKVQPKPIASLFFAHGAKFLHHNHGRDWDLLIRALAQKIPDNPTQELCRQALITYCQEDHHIDRFETIRYALKEAPIHLDWIHTLRDNAQQKTPFYQKNPRLLTLAERFCAMHTESLADALLALPTFLSPLPDYGFNEQLKFCRLKNDTLETLCQDLPQTTVDVMDLRQVTLTPEKARPLFYGLMSSKTRPVATKNLILSQPFEGYGHVKKGKHRTVLTYCLRALPYYAGLEALYADNTQLTDKTLLPFMESVIKIKSLMILTLRQNFITDKGLIALSHFIQNHRRAKKWFNHLTLLDFSANIISDTGVIALKKALHHCPNLSIEWGDNLAISDDVKTAIFDKDTDEQNWRISESLRHSERLSDTSRPSLTRDSLLTRDSQSLYSGTTDCESLSSKAKRLRQYSGTSTLSSRSVSSDGSPRSINQHLSFSTLSTAVIEKLSSGLSAEKEHILRHSITRKKFTIPEPIIEETKEDIKALIEFIEDEEIESEEIVIPKKILTASQFQQLLDSFCTLNHLKRLNLSQVTVIPNDDEATKYNDDTSSMIQVLVSVLPKFETLETIDFGEIEILEENFKQLIDVLPKTSKNLTSLLVNTSDMDEEVVAELYEFFEERKKQHTQLQQPSDVQELMNNPYIRQSLKPCAIVQKNNIPNAINWQHYYNNINFYYVIFIHPNKKRQLFFVNQEKEEGVKIKRIQYHVTDFFEWLDNQLPSLKEPASLNQVITLTEENLLTLRIITEHNYLEEERYQAVLMPDYTEQIAIRCHSMESMRSDRQDMERVFFNTLQYPQRHAYFYALYQGLCLTLEARGLLSTGLFSTSEQGTLGTYANYLIGAVTAAFPVMAPISMGALVAIDAVDGLEREAFNQNVAQIAHQRKDEKEQGLFTLCLLILLKHVDRCEDHQLNPQLAREEVNTIIDFLAQQSAQNQALFFSNESILMVAKMPELMEILFNDPICILPLKKTDEKQAMASLQRGVLIRQQGTECLPMPDTFIVPFGYDKFSDAQLPKNLRQQEENLRACLIHVAKQYQKIWWAKNFYHDFFIKKIQCHGGEEVMALAKQLENMAKTRPYYQLLEAIPSFLKELAEKSGKRPGSLQTLVVRALHPEATVSVKSCSPFLFLNEGRQIEQKRQSIINQEERLSDCINNRSSIS